jgi:hypothetical protein
LPVEQPSDILEDRLLAYYDRLKADLELLEKFDPGAMLKAQPQQPARAAPQLQVVLERAYVETVNTCDAFVTRGIVSQQPPTLEVTSERWETIA